jgi:hypothetical protein
LPAALLASAQRVGHGAGHASARVGWSAWGAYLRGQVDLLLVEVRLNVRLLLRPSASSACRRGRRVVLRGLLHWLRGQLLVAVTRYVLIPSATQALRERAGGEDVSRAGRASGRE